MNTTEFHVGFWKRVTATLIDTTLFAILAYPALFAIYGWEYFDTEANGYIAGPAEVLILYVFPAFVWISFWCWRQATPGKIAFGAKIVDAKTGGKPTTKQWILRYIGYYVSLIPFGLGYLWVAFDKRKQGLHDKMAGTVVVQTRH